MTEQRVILRDMFLGVQGQMIERIKGQKCLTHEATKGAARERGFIELLGSYLPKRYRAGQGFVMDCDGLCSHQIDIVIYDRLYSPFLFCQDGLYYIPAESVYAVLEVKPELKKSTLQYAGAKARSVRRLRRTSAPIRHGGGVVEARKPFEILGGIITLGSTWKPAFGAKFIEAAESSGEKGRIDLVCALGAGSADVRYGENGVKVRSSGEEEALIFFFLSLLSRLGELGTVTAVDFRAYLKGMGTEKEYKDQF